MEKVSLDTIKPWITQRINELLGFEDDVVIEFVFNLLESNRVCLEICICNICVYGNVLYTQVKRMLNISIKILCFIATITCTLL